MDGAPTTEAAAWARGLLAAGVVGGDVSAPGISRVTGVHVADVQAALDLCVDEGLLGEDGLVDPATSAALAAEIPPERQAEIHAIASRYWMAAGPEHLVDAVTHARAAGNLMPVGELVALAERAGRMCLSLSDYASAADLLSVAVELDPGDDPIVLGWRLCDLARAVDGLGRVAEARECLTRAAALGEHAGDASLVAHAAIASAFPLEWQAGDRRAAALLERAEAMDLDEATAVMVTAARAVAEMRLPAGTSEEQQFAWVTRPSVGHPLADDALARSAGKNRDVRGLAALAWRTTHRSPAQLERRLEISQEALDLAQLRRDPTHQVEAATWLAVDALESGDRLRYDEAVTVARWVAERDGNPRLLWRAHTLAAGAAHLDGDLRRARECRLRAREQADTVTLPGWLGADMLLAGEEAIGSETVVAMVPYVLDEQFPPLVNPVGRAVAAYVHARAGSPEVAARMARQSLRQLDLEASYLFVATRCAAVAEALGDTALATELVTVLEPWRDHVAVDGNGWWCDGPVALWLARLHAVLGDAEAAAAAAQIGEPKARALNDVRSLRARSQDRQGGGSRSGSPRVPTALLTAREHEVLRLMAAGATNREIAKQLSFSAGTIRADTTSIYRKLEARGRTDAVARAVALGLLPADLGPRA